MIQDANSNYMRRKKIGNRLFVYTSIRKNERSGCTVECTIELRKWASSAIKTEQAMFTKLFGFKFDLSEWSGIWFKLVFPSYKNLESDETKQSFLCLFAAS